MVFRFQVVPKPKKGNFWAILAIFGHLATKILTQSKMIVETSVIAQMKGND